MEHLEIDEPEAQAQLDFPVVAVGASAGGLEAVTQMFHEVETGTGMAFVLIMHLDPNHESMMAELLSSKTHLRVRQIHDGDNIEVDCLHIIPPGSSLRLDKGVFRLDPFSEPRGLRRPIDSFFTSVAQVQSDKAAGVVLSGTGADGTAGLRIIKEFGGIGVAQSPEEARYDGMPQSAISTKLVDFVLEADTIIPRLKAFFDGAMHARFPQDNEASEEAMRSIFAAIHDNVGTDFSGYKRSTLLRRLTRRMQVLEIDEVDNYLIKLKGETSEQQALARDFLINVTSFFRDRENFELVRTSIIRPMLERADVSDEIRIWIPGCSSGQEAYSYAMMIEETCQELQKRPLVTIFATDVDEAMIEQARRGSYPITMLDEIPARYQQQYVTASEERFEVVRRVREMVRFSVHNITQDPPFSKIDFVSCRNLLIYLGEELQSGLFPLLHFSLRPGGHLFLGTSESVTRSQDLFIAVDQKARIFRRNDAAKRVHVGLPLSKNARESGSHRGIGRLAQETDFPRHTSFDASNASIYEHYAPPFVRVTSDGRIIDSSGDLSLFMMSRPGDERRLDTLARDGLNDIVQPLINEALADRERRVLKDVEIASPFGVQKADVFAHPMKDETAAVIFVVKDRLQPLADQFALQPISRDRRIADLQDDLQATRLTLKGKVEEIETANEELKSSNEEMMSMNEELQSANEELTTANEELKNKIDELTLANADLDNFLQSADLAMIVLDRSIRIRHVTNAARNMLPLLRSDEGRSLAEFNIPVGNINLAKQVREVMEKGEVFSQTTDPNEAGQSYFVRITPYFFANGSVEGASITLVDISQEVELRRDLVAETRKLRLAMGTARMGSWDTDLETLDMVVDPIAAELFDLDKPGEVHRDHVFRYHCPDDVAPYGKVRDKALAADEGYSYTMRLTPPDAPTKWIQIHVQPYEDENGRKMVTGLGFDVTESMHLQQELQEQSDLRDLVMNAGRMGMADLDVDRQVVRVDEVLAEHLNLPSTGEISLDAVSSNFVEEDVPLLQENLAKAIEKGEEYEFDFRIEDPKVGIRWVRTRGRPYTTIDGHKKVAGPTVDISAMKDQQMLVEEMSHRIKNLFAVVAGLIQAAPKEHEAAQEMAADLLERVVSLGRVYDLARKDNSMKGVPLGDLLESVVGPHAVGHAIEIKGPTIFVDGDQVNTLTLIIHELTTNAAKYGALSSPDGKIDISWKIKGSRDVQLKWVESRPNFEPPEAGKGFGSLLIDTGVRQLKGEFVRRFDGKGASIDLNFTL